MKKRSFSFRRRKRIYQKRAFFVFIFLFLIFYFLGLFLFGPFFLIKDFQIKSQDPLLSKKIFLFLKTKNLLFLNKEKLKKEIEKRFLEIKKISLKKIYPDLMQIEVEERKGILVFCSQECLLSDQDGFLFSNQIKQEIPKIFVEEKVFLGKTILSQKEISFISQVVNEIKKNNISFEKIRVEKGDLIFENKERFSIFFDLKKDSQWQLEKLFTFLEKGIEKEKLEKIKIIDLRFGNFVNLEYY
ncbi:MAG: FtsQ-type POTRA domain-containing protein [Minisyncoccales bacterium]